MAYDSKGVESIMAGEAWQHAEKGGKQEQEPGIALVVR